MQVKTLKDLLADKVKDLISCEKQILEALPEIIQQVTNPGLSAGLEAHLLESAGHQRRLQAIAKKLRIKAGTTVCDGIRGILEEGEKELDGITDAEALDAAIIANSQSIEHYEIAAYGTAATWAELLDLPDVADTFHETLEEEKGADAKLTALAEQINIEAVD